MTFADVKVGKAFWLPAGEFLYGDNKKTRETGAYRISRTPVTNAEYARFVAATGHKPPSHWKGQTPPDELLDHPVVNVTWHDAVAYAEWVGARLPTEEEWEKAARGTDGRVYPWGDAFDPDRCNTYESDIGSTTPVGQYSPGGDSPYGCADMAGNVWEWTSSEWDEHRVVRGGSWSSYQGFARCAYRFRLITVDYYGSLGFRVVVSLADSDS